MTLVFHRLASARLCAAAAVCAIAFAVLGAPSAAAQPPPAAPQSPSSAAPQAHQGRVVRISGESRVATAIAASRHAFPDGAETVVLAAAGRFPDALAAVPLAERAGAPLLLVDQRTEGPVLDEIHRLGADRALLVAAFGAVPVVVELELLREGIDVERVAGDGRFHTAARIARTLGPGPRPEAVVASGATFADALPAGPLAAVMRLPLLLTATDALPPDPRAVLADFSVESTLLVGGGEAVSRQAATALPSPTRLSGPDRYTTSVRVAERLLAEGGGLGTVAIATGRDFADALAAGAVAARAKGPLLLVDGQDPANAQAVFAFLEEHAGEIGRVLVFGGRAAISDEVRERIAEAVR